MGFPTLLESELLAVSKALGDTEFGFTGTEIGLLLPQLWTTFTKCIMY